MEFGVDGQGWVQVSRLFGCFQHVRFRVWGLGFGVSGLGFGVYIGFRAWSLCVGFVVRLRFLCPQSLVD